MADAVLDDCERYWRAAGISHRRASEMRSELAGHLAEAAANGKSAEAVIGPDVAAFAGAWAQAQKPDARLPKWETIVITRTNRRIQLGFIAILIGVAAAVSLAVANYEGSSSMDDATWIWIWLGAALFLGFAEMVTAGFFMLPFAAGAVIAFVLAAFGVPPAIQLIVFLVASIVALIGLQRYVTHEDEHAPRLGANRMLDRHGIVLEKIDPVAGAGRVRVDSELWRATTDGDSIASGAEVRVVEIRGTRLVVETVE